MTNYQPHTHTQNFTSGLISAVLIVTACSLQRGGREGAALAFCCYQNSSASCQRFTAVAFLTAAPGREQETTNMG